jgi:hypothetical protein
VPSRLEGSDAGLFSIRVPKFPWTRFSPRQAGNLAAACQASRPLRGFAGRLFFARVIDYGGANAQRTAPPVDGRAPGTRA